MTQQNSSQAAEIDLEGIYDAIAQLYGVREVEINVELDADDAVKVLSSLGIGDAYDRVFASPRRHFTARDLQELINQGALK